jgi:hypothetical protein
MLLEVLEWMFMWFACSFSYGMPDFLSERSVRPDIKPITPMPTPPPMEPISTQPSPPPEFNVVPYVANPSFQTMFPDDNDDVALFDTARRY